jgi:hypothetical protein
MAFSPFVCRAINRSDLSVLPLGPTDHIIFCTADGSFYDLTRRYSWTGSPLAFACVDIQAQCGTREWVVGRWHQLLIL